MITYLYYIYILHTYTYPNSNLCYPIGIRYTFFSIKNTTRIPTFRNPQAFGTGVAPVVASGWGSFVGDPRHTNQYGDPRYTNPRRANEYLGS